LVEARRPWRPRVAIDAARARGLGALGAAIASRIRPSSLSISCSRIEGAATTFGVRVRLRLRVRVRVGLRHRLRLRLRVGVRVRVSSGSGIGSASGEGPSKASGQGRHHLGHR